MKTVILIILSIIGLLYFIYWIREIILRASKSIYNLGYKKGCQDYQKLLESFEEK